MPFINVFLNDDLHRALKDVAKAQHRPMYALVPNLLAESVVKWEKVEAKKPVEEVPQDVIDAVERDTRDMVDFGVSKPAPKPGSVKKRGNR